MLHHHYNTCNSINQYESYPPQNRSLYNENDKTLISSKNDSGDFTRTFDSFCIEKIPYSFIY